MITAIDADETVSIEVLRSEGADLRDLRRVLEAVTPSSVMRSSHDLLIASCTFGAMAASLRVDAVGDNSLDARRQASAAAAGSLMLFEQACANLGCTGTPR